MAAQNFFLSDQLKADLNNFLFSTSVFWKPKESQLTTEAKKICFLLRESPEAKSQPQIKQICMNFLAGIGQFKQNQNLFRELHLLEELVPLLENQNEQMSLPAFCSFAELISENPENQEVLYKTNNFIDIIIGGCLKQNEIIKEMSLRILMNYSLNEKIREELVLKKGFLENVIKTIPPSSSKQNTIPIGYAISIIGNISMIKNQITSNHMLCLKPPIVLQLLGDYLNSPILIFRETAMQSIQYLTEYNSRWRNAVILGFNQTKGIFDVVISQLQSNNQNIVRRILRILISISVSFESEANPYAQLDFDQVENFRKQDPNFEDPELTTATSMQAIKLFMGYKQHILTLLFKIIPTKGNPNNETYIGYLPSVLKLLSILSSSPQLMDMFRQLNGLQIYTSMFLFYTSLPNANPDIAAHIIHTLNNLLYDDQNLHSFIENGGIQQFIDAMSDSNNSDFTISEVARLIANICINFEEARTQILSSSVIIQKFTSLLNLQAQPKLQEQSLRALTNLSLSVTSMESAKYMIESGTLNLVSKFITQTPVESFQNPNAVGSKQYVLYLLSLKYFINLSANMSVQPHVLKCFGGVEYFINLLKFFKPTNANANILQKLIEIPLNIMKLLSNFTVKGRTRKYIHETAGVIDLINSFSKIPQLSEQLDILSANLKFPYEKFYADDDLEEKALPEIIPLKDDEESGDEEDRELIIDEAEIQKKKKLEDEYLRAKEQLAKEEAQRKLEEERHLREEEEEKKKIEEEKKLLKQKQIEFEEAQKRLIEEQNRLKKIEEENRKKRELEVKQEQQRKEEALLQQLFLEQEKLKEEQRQQELLYKEEQLKNEINSSSLKLQHLLDKISQKKVKLFDTEIKLKKMNSKLDTRKGRVQRTSFHIEKQRTRAQSIAVTDPNTRKSLPTGELEAPKKTKGRKSEGKNDDNNNNNNEPSPSIIQKLELAEKKLQRVEKTFVKLEKRVSSLRASIPIYITQFNSGVDNRSQLIQQYIQWKTENKLKTESEQFEQFEKLSEVIETPKYDEIMEKFNKDIESAKKDKKERRLLEKKQQEERKRIEREQQEKLELERQEKERIAREQCELKEKELLARIEKEKQRIQSEQSSREKEDKEKEDQLLLESKKREEQLLLEKKKLEEEIARTNKEAEDKEKERLIQREKRRKAIEEAKKRFSEQTDYVQTKEKELNSSATPVASKQVDEEEQKKKLAIKRTNISREIYDTEKSYVDSLSILVHKFQRPLMQQAENDALLEEPSLLDLMAVRAIFGCVEVILNFNNILLEGLEQRLKNWHEDQCLGDIFITLTDYLRCYVQYVNNYNTAMTELTKAKANNSSFVKFVAKVEKARECKNLSLESFLIMPIQRVPRYVLLLTDLLRNTPNNHADYSNLSSALEKMKETGVIINERKREAESLSKLYEVYAAMGGKVHDLIQPSRRFITEGVCKYSKKESASHWKNGYLHLFNDVILVSKPSKRLDSFEFKLKVLLLHVHLAALEDSKKIKNSLKIMGSEDESNATKVEVCVSFKTPQDREFWYNSISSQNDDVLSRRYSFTRNSFRGRPVF